jgi:hypothetical protein
MTSLIINRLMREMNEYYDNIQNSSNFRYMNKDNVEDTNFIIPPNDLLLLDQIDLVMINNAITRRKNRFIAIHTILSQTLIIPSNNENNIRCIRNRNYIRPSYY